MWMLNLAEIKALLRVNSILCALNTRAGHTNEMPTLTVVIILLIMKRYATFIGFFERFSLTKHSRSFDYITAVF